MLSAKIVQFISLQQVIYIFPSHKDNSFIVTLNLKYRNIHWNSKNHSSDTVLILIQCSFIQSFYETISMSQPQVIYRYLNITSFHLHTSQVFLLLLLLHIFKFFQTPFKTIERHFKMWVKMAWARGWPVFSSSGVCAHKLEVLSKHALISPMQTTFSLVKIKKKPGVVSQTLRTPVVNVNLKIKPSHFFFA